MSHTLTWYFEFSCTGLPWCSHWMLGLGSPTCKQSNTKYDFQGTAKISPKDTILARTEKGEKQAGNIEKKFFLAKSGHQLEMRFVLIAIGGQMSVSERGLGQVSRGEDVCKNSSTGNGNILVKQVETRSHQGTVTHDELKILLIKFPKKIIHTFRTSKQLMLSKSKSYSQCQHSYALAGLGTLANIISPR